MTRTLALANHEIALTRRTVLKAGYGVGGAALFGWHTWSVRQDMARAAAAQAASPAGTGLWLIPAPDALRPVAPGVPTQAETDELLALQASRTPAQANAAIRWGRGPAGLPWTDVALDLIVRHTPNPPRAARALALLHAAVSDAVVAAEDARAVWSRPAPAGAVPGLRPMDGLAASGPSFPATHAAVASAAAGILAHLFPAEPAGALDALAAEAAGSRLVAGLAYRSDIDAGLAIGHAVAALAVERALGDGADAVWDGARPDGEGTWQPTPPKYVGSPLEPLAGAWRTWLPMDVVAARPAPPPAWGSVGWHAELAAVQEAVARRTPAQEEAVLFWAGGPGTPTPAGIWTGIAAGLARRDGLDDLAAARAMALASVAMADAFVCCWDAKFAYWTARPVTADPALNVLIPTPPFPSYTSGHATVSAAAAAILGHLFPADAEDLTARAFEAKQTRLWAGIHYPLDNDTGAAMGALVGRLAAQRG